MTLLPHRPPLRAGVFWLFKTAAMSEHLLPDFQSFWIWRRVLYSFGVLYELAL